MFLKRTPFSSQTLVPTAPSTVLAILLPQPLTGVAILQKWATAQKKSVFQNGLLERKEASITLTALHSTQFLLLPCLVPFKPRPGPPPSRPHPRVLISQAFRHSAHYPKLCYLNELLVLPLFLRLLPLPWVSSSGFPPPILSSLVPAS